MMTKPFISIITVTLNNLNGLKKTAHSITTQTFDNYEWIIVDGLSNDGTAGFLNHCKAHVISEEDNGLYDAMNKGIGRAIGDYLLFLNAGDIFPSVTTLDLIHDTIQKLPTPPNFIYGDALEIYEGRDIYKYARPHEFAMQGMFTHHQSMFYRREAVEDLRYDLKYQIAADYDFTLKFLEKHPTAHHVPLPFCLFESGGLSENHALQGRIEQFKIRHALKQSIIENVQTFFSQSIAHLVRKLSPKTYWVLKRLSLRA